MVESTKIKFFTTIGTLAIISTSYILHASSFYTQLYENGATTLKNYSKKVEVDSDTLNITKLEPSKIVEKKQIIKEDINASVKLNNTHIAKSLKIEKKDIAVESKQITQNIEKPIVIEVVEIKDPIKKDIITEKVSNEDKLSNFNKYLYLQSSGALTKQSKEYLDQVIPLVNKLPDYYIEVEGYSVKSALANELSLKYAQEVAKYLKSRNINKKIIITSYADSYPIIDDQNDIRNSRVELKFRRNKK